MRGVIIGRSSLERTDAARGVRTGRFRPGPGYDLIQPVFRLFAEATSGRSGEVSDAAKLARYYKARDALPLELVDGAGGVVAARTIHIVDRTAEQGAEALDLEVVVAEPANG